MGGYVACVHVPGLEYLYLLHICIQNPKKPAFFKQKQKKLMHTNLIQLHTVPNRLGLFWKKHLDE